MSNPNLTYICCVLDHSGSMAGLRDQTVEGFNGFLQSQKDAPGKALFSLVLFDSTVKVRLDCVDLGEVSPLTVADYWRGGGSGTALYDAVGGAIAAAHARIDSLPDESKPSKVLFLVITDGHENASREFRHAALHQLVTEARTQHRWEFVFMGANLDAPAQAADLGFNPINALRYVPDSAGTAAVYNAMSDATRSYRSGLEAQVDNFFGPSAATGADPLDPSAAAAGAMTVFEVVDDLISKK